MTESGVPAPLDLPQQQPKVFQPPRGGEVISHNGLKYYIGPFIGQGGFGAVYNCVDEWGNALVAKVMLPVNRPYSDVRHGWERELTNLVTLRHPNITYVYDAFEYRDTFYLVIEKCSSTLDALMAMPNLNGRLWLPYVAQAVLQGLHFIHASGYVHKDLHPGNVFMLWQRDNMVPQKEPVLTFKIGDLGISRLEADVDIFNATLAQWMLPPEFLNPQFGPIGRPVDIYHAGLLFLGLLLGRFPTFTHRQILDGQPRQLAENLGSPVGLVIAKTLRRTVAERTPSALEFWREIGQATNVTVTFSN